MKRSSIKCDKTIHLTEIIKKFVTKSQRLPFDVKKKKWVLIKKKKGSKI